MAKRILMTGATSFTGSHMARAFALAGWEVTATLTREHAAYSADELVRTRIKFSGVDRWVESAPFGSENFLKTADLGCDVFLNHGAEIKGYRDAQFDYLASVRRSVENAREVMTRLAAGGCRRVLHSGSIFEPDEGADPAGLALVSEALSLYGVSKALVWQSLRFFAGESGLPISKVVIPNPVGPLENPDRLVPFFVKLWKEGQTPTLRTPHLIRDNLPASWLAGVYLRAAKGLDHKNSEILRPSGFVLSNGEFADEIVQKFRARGVALPMPLNSEQASVREPLRRINQDPCPELDDPAAVKAFWDEWKSFLFG